ncbi:PadR family transcriptional regulator [Helcococcus kunzii]|uniref:PadR family transcriptional regulator n=1 Tax=Helcococcus kunzii TaxID=40091 RepID=UPI0024AE1776|nr:PadR family transcriptional regulator [Helcococcus kunzii]
MTEISSDILRGYTDLIILYILYETPSYGYEISKTITEISQEKLIMKETTLYSAFKRLEKSNYIESFKSENEDKSRRTYYRITDNGKKYYLEKTKEWDLTKQIIEKFII